MSISISATRNIDETKPMWWFGCILNLPHLLSNLLEQILNHPALELCDGSILLSNWSQGIPLYPPVDKARSGRSLGPVVTSYIVP